MPPRQRPAASSLQRPAPGAGSGRQGPTRYSAETANNPGTCFPAGWPAEQSASGSLALWLPSCQAPSPDSAGTFSDPRQHPSCHANQRILPTSSTEAHTLFDSGRATPAPSPSGQMPRPAQHQHHRRCQNHDERAQASAQPDAPCRNFSRPTPQDGNTPRHPPLRTRFTTCHHHPTPDSTFPTIPPLSPPTRFSSINLSPHPTTPPRHNLNTPHVLPLHATTKPPTRSP